MSTVTVEMHTAQIHVRVRIHEVNFRNALWFRLQWRLGSEEPYYGTVIQSPGALPRLPPAIR